VILLVTNAQDLTTDFIVLELQRRGVAYARLNTERLPQAQVRLGFEAADAWAIDFPRLQLSGDAVRAAYFRRPGLPAIDTAVRDEGERAYCASEWGGLLKTLYGRLEPRWLSAPSAIMVAEDKPRQLLAARAAGFRIPETLVTNAFGYACRFLDGAPAIAKPLREARIDGGREAVIFTSRVEQLSERDERAMQAAPIILQREVLKRADIRVTVVGDRVFAAAIGSQAREETEVDWRRGGVADLAHEVVDLPDTVAARCVALVRALNLGFGAIDLVWDRDGEFWFLEVNPNGQWAWIENRTGLPIAAALVDALEEIAAR